MSRLPKVLHVIHSGAIGGGPRVVLSLVSHVEAEHTVAAPEDGPILHDAALRGAHAVTIAHAGEFSFGLSIPLLARFARKFDLVHLHGQFAGFYGAWAAALASVPAVYTAHFPSFVTDRSASTRARNYLAELVPSRLARTVVACSQTSRDEYLRRHLVTRSRLITIFNGVEETQPSRWASDVRSELGLGVDQPMVLGIGRLTAQKGFDLLIDAMPYLRRMVPDAVAVIVGDGELRPQLAAQVANLCLGSAVRLTGWRTDIRDLLEAATVVSVPSRYDIFPLVPLEAMMAGRAVVATDLPALREAVIEGVTGRLVAFSEIELAESLAQLVTLPQDRRNMQCAARERARANFSVETMAKNYQRAYAEVLA